MVFLEFPSGKISMVYGAAATGKTTLCMQLSLETAQKKKVLFVDTEESFSVERIKQMNPSFEKLLDKIIVFRVNNFEEQINFLNNIEEVAKKTDFGLIIVDTIGMHYRKALQDENYHEVNQLILPNLRKLKHVAQELNIPVILTNQIYSKMDGTDSHIGGKMLEGFAKFLVELKKEPRKAVILKPERKEINFRIEDSGLIFL